MYAVNNANLAFRAENIIFRLKTLLVSGAKRSVRLHPVQL